MKKRKKLNRNLLKNGIPILIAIILILCIYIVYLFCFKIKDKEFLEKIETSLYANITDYRIYGIHMNIEGAFTLEEDVDNIKLVLANGKKEIEIPWEIKKENQNYTFKTSEFNNEGINLEKLPTEDLYLLIKTENKDKNDIVTKYYSVNNKSIYNNLEYYTLTKNKKNNKIDIEWNTYEECPTLRFSIKETTLPKDIYDITIDPGHGISKTTGVYDSGSIGSLNGNVYYEETVNLTVSKKLKEKLEELGYKVTMTRESKDDVVSIYDKMGSATMANDTKSKFSFAIHHNSYDYQLADLKGLEIYVANDTNFDLANSFITEITKNANTTISPKETYMIAPGIYQRFLTEEEIKEDTVQPSNKTTDTIWYYYIREVGGVSTHATNDGRYAPVYPKNEHYNSNNTAEPYLFELGYMNNETDLNNIVNNPSGYALGIALGLQKYLEQE